MEVGTELQRLLNTKLDLVEGQLQGANVVPNIVRINVQKCSTYTDMYYRDKMSGRYLCTRNNMYSVSAPPITNFIFKFIIDQLD